MGINIQTALRLVYPPRCLMCGCQVDSDFGLCGPCWRDTPFTAGLCCDICGVPLPGESSDQAESCDECMRVARPWSQGRAALIYRDNGRKMVLALKHGDRHEIVRPAALWMARAARPLLQDNMLIVPVPLHWTRLLKRRFNQSALLAQALSKQVELPYCPDVLVRHRRTKPLEGLGPNQRFEMMDSAISVHPKRRHMIVGRPVLLVDDVLTSGATLSAAASACLDAGASKVSVLALARVAKDA